MLPIEMQSTESDTTPKNGKPRAHNAANQDSSSPQTGSPALSGTQLDRVLREWNETLADFPDACTHELFEQQVARTPEAIAVIGGGKSLTYRELNERSNQVAHFLRNRGVGPDVLVGVCLERTPDLVVALLGVWKSGGAYVPLDSTYPEDRLSFMVGDSAVRVLLTQEKCKRLFPSMEEKTICLDSDWPVIAKESSSNPEGNTAPSNLAYVMYTSGSTGKPKGAMILHRGLVNYLWWAIRTYAVKEGGSVPVHSSISFDLTVTSLYPALLAGGQVELLAEDVGAQNLLAALRNKKDRNLVKITPAHLEALGLQLNASEVSNMTRTFVIGGENLLAESLRLWREASPSTRLINEYGPTETVVGCCVYEVQPGDPKNGSVPIGRPIANTQLYILDESLQPVAPGVMGELFIGGAGVARGYLNRPELTRERFLHNPFSEEIDARMYKTGDLARYREDGIIEYLGRVDNQVKVRGYRIELGEIEAALASQPDVQSCVVLAREDTPGDKQLVGYVVPREGKSPAVDQMQSFLKEGLPEYMVPAKFVFLDAFPLTNNGKVDRKALPAPQADEARSDQSGKGPRNATEETLAAIWKEIFKLDSIGIHDDFFELGGHSLLAIKVMARIRDRFGVDLPVLVLFESPTIAALAECVSQRVSPQTTEADSATETDGASQAAGVSQPPAGSQIESASQIMVQIQAGKPGRLPFFCVCASAATALGMRPLATAMDQEIPFYSVQNKGLDGSEPFHTIEENARFNVEQIRKVQPHGPYRLGGYCAGGTKAFAMANLLEEAGEKVDVVIMVDTWNRAYPRSLPKYKAVGRFVAFFFARAAFHLRHMFSMPIKEWGAYPMGRLKALGRNIERMTKPKNAVEAKQASVEAARAKVVMNSDIRDVELQLKLESNDRNAWDRFIPKPFRGDVFVVSASERPANPFDDKYLGWKPFVLGSIDAYEAEGNHDTIYKGATIRKIAEKVNARLA